MSKFLLQKLNDGFESHYTAEIVVVSSVRFAFVVEGVDENIVFRVGKILESRHYGANAFEEFGIFDVVGGICYGDAYIGFKHSVGGLQIAERAEFADIEADIRNVSVIRGMSANKHSFKFRRKRSFQLCKKYVFEFFAH